MSAGWAQCRSCRRVFDPPTVRAAELWAGIEGNREDYARFLGEAFLEFRLVVESMLAARDAYRARQADRGGATWQQLRERTMYANFLQQYNRLPAGVYWGHFGHSHIFRKRSENTEWFGVRLEGDGSPVAGRVLSILFAYEDCTAMTRSGSSYGTSSAGNVLPGLFDFYEGSDPILFRLTGEGSPARFYQVVLHGEPGGSAEYFDYLLLIRGATPTVPLGGSGEPNQNR